MEDHELSNVKSLIKHAKILVKKNDEILAATGGKFNIFRVSGVAHYETIHSSIIAEFLNPHGSHGMHEKFLDAFLSTIDDTTGVDPSRCRVKTEFSFSEGRIDILIEDNANAAIVIENKIYASDGHQQLVRYSEFLKNKRPNELYYLTLWETEAEDCSVLNSEGERVKHTRISYRNHVLKWLERCIQIAAEYPMVRETLRQYRNHIKEILGMNSDKELQDLSALICHDRESYVAAGKIVSSWGAVRGTVLEKHIVPRIEEVFKEFSNKHKLISFTPVISISSESCSGFHLRHQGTEHLLRFEFDRGGFQNLFYGIKKPHSSIQPSFDVLPKGFKSAEWWACWCYLSRYQNWGDDFFLNMMFDKTKQEEFKITISNCLEELLPLVEQLS